MLGGAAAATDDRSNPMGGFVQLLKYVHALRSYLVGGM